MKKSCWWVWSVQQWLTPSLYQAFYYSISCLYSSFRTQTAIFIGSFRAILNGRHSLGKCMDRYCTLAFILIDHGTFFCKVLCVQIFYMPTLFLYQCTENHIGAQLQIWGAKFTLHRRQVTKKVARFGDYFIFIAKAAQVQCIVQVTLSMVANIFWS